MACHKDPETGTVGAGSLAKKVPEIGGELVTGNRISLYPRNILHKRSVN